MAIASIERQFINLHFAIQAGDKTKALSLLLQLERDVMAEKCQLTEQLANARGQLPPKAPQP